MFKPLAGFGGVPTPNMETCGLGDDACSLRNVTRNQQWEFNQVIRQSVSYANSFLYNWLIAGGDVDWSALSGVTQAILSNQITGYLSYTDGPLGPTSFTDPYPTSPGSLPPIPGLPTAATFTPDDTSVLIGLVTFANPQDKSKAIAILRG